MDIYQRFTFQGTFGDGVGYVEEIRYSLVDKNFHFDFFRTRDVLSLARNVESSLGIATPRLVGGSSLRVRKVSYRRG